LRDLDKDFNGKIEKKEFKAFINKELKRFEE
jgi:hypothetical protein